MDRAWWTREIGEMTQELVRLTNIDSPIVGEEVGISTLPANAGPACWAECMSNPLLAECVGLHLVETALPGDVRFEWVNHQGAVNMADRACARVRQ